jgi:hypothetical protein
VQATVHRYDAATGAGSVVTDAGLVVPFSAETFAGSGLRHARPGQRLTVQLGEVEGVPAVVHLHLGTVGAPPAVPEGRP